MDATTPRPLVPTRPADCPSQRSNILRWLGSPIPDPIRPSTLRCCTFAVPLPPRGSPARRLPRRELRPRSDWPLALGALRPESGSPARSRGARTQYPDGTNRGCRPRARASRALRPTSGKASRSSLLPSIRSPAAACMLDWRIRRGTATDVHLPTTRWSTPRSARGRPRPPTSTASRTPRMSPPPETRPRSTLSNVDRRQSIEEETGANAGVPVTCKLPRRYRDRARGRSAI